MSEDLIIGPELPAMVDAMVDSYGKLPGCRHIDRAYLPARDAVEELLDRLLELVYPGFFGRQDLTTHNVAYHVGELLPRIAYLAHQQIEKALCYVAENSNDSADTSGCSQQASDLTRSFLQRLPQVRVMLDGDVQASFDGDPAAMNTDEIILAYPGLFAISVFRLAHEMYDLDVPLLPRVMCETAHARTGIDIHPGARIGRRFFIDHGTGVVIGETTDIGDDVKVYQGVTLGALSFPRDGGGRLIRGEKRHPTVGNGVTIYANAIILGGKTDIGDYSVIGGSVFLTQSVPAHSLVTFNPPELTIRDRAGTRPQPLVADYQI